MSSIIFISILFHAVSPIYSVSSKEKFTWACCLLYVFPYPKLLKISLDLERYLQEPSPEGEKKVEAIFPSSACTPAD